MTRKFLHFIDGKILYCPDLHKNKKVSTVKDCACEDLKTNLSRPQDLIPKGTVLEIKQIITNFYGDFILTSYRGKNYYIKPSNLLWSTITNG
ncbi:hypothetical protein SIPHO076v1_p0025 [Vibrio phage PS34B.1]|nr:hypothetical protein SIPHO076v1_p0025 [Vibrio phage PS34B.1]